MSRPVSLHPLLLLIVPATLLGWLLWASAPVQHADASHAGALHVASPEAGEQDIIPTSEASEYAPFDLNDAFVTPAGPKGLEYSARVRSLEGRKVAVAGFMVKNYGPDPSVFVSSDVGGGGDGFVCAGDVFVLPVGGNGRG